MALQTLVEITQQVLQVVCATPIGHQLVTAMGIARQLLRQRRLLHHPHPHQHHQHHHRLQPQTENVAGVSGVMHLLVEATLPPAVVHSATTTSRMLAVGMEIVKGLLQLRHQLLLDHPLLPDPHLLHQRHILHTRQLRQPHQVLAVWNCWATWKIGAQILNGGMRTCPAIA